jgi:hypothetical protein
VNISTSTTKERVVREKKIPTQILTRVCIQGLFNSYIASCTNDTICHNNSLSKQHQSSIKVFKNTIHVYNMHVGNIDLCKGCTKEVFILYILIYYFYLQYCMSIKFQKLCKPPNENYFLEEVY